MLPHRPRSTDQEVFFRSRATSYAQRIVRLSPVVGLLVLTTSSSLLLSSCTSVWAQTGKSERQIEARPIPGPPPALPTPRVNAVESSSSQPSRVYTGTSRGVLVSGDDGRTWDPLPVNGSHAEVFSLALHPTIADVVYVGRRDGLWGTSDGGKSWSLLPSPSLKPFIPLAVAIAESQPNVMYMATAREGMYRSDSGGFSWTSVSKGLPEARSGGRPVEIRTLAVHPLNAQTVYLAHERHGVYRSTDGGASWHPFQDGLPLLLRRGPDPPQFVFDPEDPARLYLVLAERIHSHLVKNRLYVTSKKGQWLPVEVDLPANQTVVQLHVDKSTGKLRLRIQDGVWELPLTD